MPKMETPNRPDHQWLAFVTVLPTNDPASRMLVMRTLESMGSAVLRDGVYLLPDSTSCRGSLTHLGEHVKRLNGTSHLLAITAQSPEQQQYFHRLFDRSAQYDEMIKSVQGLRAAYGVSEPGSISKVLGKLRRDFEALGELDFFPSAIRQRAEEALKTCEREIHALMFPKGSENSSSLRPRNRAAGNTWATKVPLLADRLASAWLIRRFIDTEAAFLWLDKGKDCPQSAIGFGFENAEYSNSSTEITFEALLKSFGLNGDLNLVKIANLIRHLEGSGPVVSEAAGVETLLLGARRRAVNEDDLLSESAKTFDLLYEAYSDRAKKQ